RDDRDTALYIETVPKRGYRFVAEVREVRPSMDPVPPRPTVSRSAVVTAGVVAAVIAAVLAGWYWTRSKTPNQDHSHGMNAKPTTLAVLPFRGLSDNAGDESWGIGMTD